MNEVGYECGWEAKQIQTARVCRTYVVCVPSVLFTRALHVVRVARVVLGMLRTRPVEPIPFRGEEASTRDLYMDRVWPCVRACVHEWVGV